MLAKMTSKNQITIPKEIAKQYSTVYFDVEIEENRIILTPVSTTSAEKVRKKLAELDISEQDVAEAVVWARK